MPTPTRPSTPTTLYLVRHAETQANSAAIWQGSLDAPLTERGRMQVAATAEAFARLAESVHFDALYTSPLGRARTTATAIAGRIPWDHTNGDGPLRIEPQLSEFTIGDWEGRSFEDLRNSERLWERWDADATFAPPNGESPAIFSRRAIGVLRRITTEHAGERIVVVTHGGLIGHVLASWLGSGPADWRRFEVHNCSISVLEGSDGQWKALALNDTHHLAPELTAQHDSSAWNR